MRRLYLRLWHEHDDGTPWPMINANLKFATLNATIALCVLTAKLALTLT